ncbi:MAG: hypothetical protein ACXADX_16545 [Candidatus Hodarchaeales archaeon]
MNFNRENVADDAICWDFSDQDQIPYPILTLTVTNPTNSIVGKLDSKVDTGFNGALGLSESTIESLKLEPIGSTLIRTASGEKYVSYYKTVVSIPRTPFANLKTLALRTPRPVIGRAILNLGTWLYDGSYKKWCFIG